MKHETGFRALKTEILDRIRESSGMATDLDLLDKLSRTAAIS
jgi:NitT/TauT family transport system ATP-binding protein